MNISKKAISITGETELDLYRCNLRFIEHSNRYIGGFAEIEKQNEYVYNNFLSTDKVSSMFDIENDFFDVLELIKRKDYIRLNENKIISLFDELNAPQFYQNLLFEHYTEIKDFFENYDFNLLSIEEFNVALSRYTAKIDIEYLPYTERGYEKILFNNKGIEINENKIMIVYHCYSYVDVLFSFLHYYKTKGYKVACCPHCERFFFKTGTREDSNRKFCNRKSTYFGFEHLPCEQAVNNERRLLKKRYENIYKNFYNNGKDTVWFSDECQKFKDIIKIKPTPQNLNNYRNFLFSDLFPRKAVSK